MCVIRYLALYVRNRESGDIDNSLGTSFKSSFYRIYKIALVANEL